MLKDREIYDNRTEKLIWRELCPFCDLKSQSECIIWEWKYWYIQHNMYPYLWLKDHIMAVPFSHKVFSSELSSEEFAEMREIQIFIKNFYWKKDYFSFMRESIWNRSVEHLHYQYLPWLLRTSRIERILKEQWF